MAGVKDTERTEEIQTGQEKVQVRAEKVQVGAEELQVKVKEVQAGAEEFQIAADQLTRENGGEGEVAEPVLAAGVQVMCEQAGVIQAAAEEGDGMEYESDADCFYERLLITK